MPFDAEQGHLCVIGGFKSLLKCMRYTVVALRRESFRNQSGVLLSEEDFGPHEANLSTFADSKKDVLQLIISQPSWTWLGEEDPDSVS